MKPKDDSLIVIPSLNLQPGVALPFDLFVRLPVSNRIILYRRQGSAIAQEKLDQGTLRELCFFISREHYDQYLEYAAREVLQIISQRPPDVEKMQETAAQMLGNAFAQGTSEEAEQLVRNMGDVVAQLVSQVSAEGIESRRQIFARFSKIARDGTDFQRHPMHVASLVVMMTMGIGLSDQRTLVEAGLAALLHDIGLTQLPTSVIKDAHRYQDLGSVSKALLGLHPSAAMEVLKARGVQVSKLMESMILQHHEMYNGQGYPQGLAKQEVHPLAQVLMVADLLADLLGSPGEEPIGKKVESLFLYLEKNQSVEPSLLRKLKAMIID